MNGPAQVAIRNQEAVQGDKQGGGKPQKDKGNHKTNNPRKGRQRRNTTTAARGGEGQNSNNSERRQSTKEHKGTVHRNHVQCTQCRLPPSSLSTAEGLFTARIPTYRPNWARGPNSLSMRFAISGHAGHTYVPTNGRLLFSATPSGECVHLEV